MTHVLIAIAVELIQDVRNLMGNPVSDGCFSDKKGRRERYPRLPSNVAARCPWHSMGKTTWTFRANPTPGKKSDDDGDNRSADPKSSPLTDSLSNPTPFTLFSLQ